MYVCVMCMEGYRAFQQLFSFGLYIGPLTLLKQRLC